MVLGVDPRALRLLSIVLLLLFSFFYLFFSQQLPLPPLLLSYSVSFRGAALLSHHPCWGELLDDIAMLLWVILKGSVTDLHPQPCVLLFGVLKLCMIFRTRCLLGPEASILLTL